MLFCCACNLFVFEYVLLFALTTNKSSRGGSCVVLSTLTQSPSCGSFALWCRKLNKLLCMELHPSKYATFGLRPSSTFSHFTLLFVYKLFPHNMATRRHAQFIWRHFTSCVLLQRGNFSCSFIICYCNCRFSSLHVIA